MNPLPPAFPALDFGNNIVNPKQHVEPGTGTAKMWGYLVITIGLIVASFASMGLILLTIPLGLIVDFFNRKKAMAQLKGSALEVNSEQLPELHRCAQDFARRLGMKETPLIYVVESNVINAAAMKVGSRQVIILVDDIVEACLRSGDQRAIGFILAHEMAHHALGHTGLIPRTLFKAYLKLSRLNEFSSDSVARALVQDDSASINALLVLLTGPQLIPYVNTNALLKQAREVAEDKNSAKSERMLTHPLLLRRLHRMLVK